MVYGVGVTDLKTRENNVSIRSYEVWKRMLSRCYNEKDKDYHSYGGSNVTVHPSWFLFSNFKDWYDKNYKVGYQLDKDIMSFGDKIYSVETCAFVPLKENMSERNKRVGKIAKGRKNYCSKPKEHYATNHTRTCEFKKRCKIQGWIFENFEKVISGKKHGRENRFYFIEKKQE